MINLVAFGRISVAIKSVTLSWICLLIGGLMPSVLAILIGIGLFGVCTSAQAATYVLGTLSNHIPADYAGNSFAPPAVLFVETRANCEKCKETHAEVQVNGKEIQRYLSADVLARTDYANRHYLIVRGKISKELSETRVFDDLGQRWTANISPNLFAAVSYQAELIQVFATGIEIYDLNTHKIRQLSLPVDAEHVLTQAFVATDNQYAWAVIALDKFGKVWLSNGEQWFSTASPVLSKHSDRQNVLTVYPHGNEVIAAIYTHLNVYNKGVLLFYAATGKPIDYAWLINSDEQNYGFSPAIKWQNDSVILVGKASSIDSLFAVRLAEKDVRELVYKTPPHTVGFEREAQVSAMAGVSVARVAWQIQSYVQGLANVEYHLANTLYKGVNLEGRSFDHNLALSYLKNETDNLALQSGGELAREASSQLLAYIDFDSGDNQSSVLRLVIENANLNGVATYTNTMTGAFQSVTFNHKFNRLGLYDLGEQGRYFKLEYTQSQLPIAVGFSDTGPATVSYFDTGAKFSELAIGFGYDELAYAKRYEANYAKWYLSGAAGVGFGLVNFSDAIIRQAETHLTRSLNNNNLFFGLHGALEGGYLLQQRAKALHGFGYSLAIGLRVQYDGIGAGYSKSNDASSTTQNDTSANVQFNRDDLIYGPYFRYNLLF